MRRTCENSAKKCLQEAASATTVYNAPAVRTSQIRFAERHVKQVTS